MRERRYPIGIQTFSEIIRKGYLYADIYGRKEGETTPGALLQGIIKFSQLSIFSTINNLTNVSMDPRFGSICGITE